MAREASFENVRGIVREDVGRLSDAELVSALATQGIDAENMEGWFSDFGKFAAKLAPTVLPIAGKLVGSVFGGPVGGAIGGQLGSLAGGAVTSATGVKPANIPFLSALGGGGSPAAGQLLQTITRPETLQALASMAMGSMGRQNVPVGGRSVPVSAFSNLLGVLAGKAEAEVAQATAARSAVPEYMADYAGEAKGDPAVEEHRAAALYELLNQESLRDWHEAESEGGWEAESESESESEAEAIRRADEAERFALELELADSEYD
jgi:hypothetical protein